MKLHEKKGGIALKVKNLERHYRKTLFITYQDEGRDAEYYYDGANGGGTTIQCDGYTVSLPQPYAEGRLSAVAMVTNQDRVLGHLPVIAQALPAELSPESIAQALPPGSSGGPLAGQPAAWYASYLPTGMFKSILWTIFGLISLAFTVAMAKTRPKLAAAAGSLLLAGAASLLWLHSVHTAQAAGHPPANAYFFHNGHLGEALAITDREGALVWSTEYQPFGQLQGESGSITIGDPNDTGIVWKPKFRFPGQYEDPETGLFYNHHRYYNPDLGGYTRPDPLGLFASGPSLYTYVGNDPVNWVDPTGKANSPAYAAQPDFGGSGSGCGNGGALSTDLPTFLTQIIAGIVVVLGLDDAEDELPTNVIPIPQISTSNPPLPSGGPRGCPDKAIECGACCIINYLDDDFEVGASCSSNCVEFQVLCEQDDDDLVSDIFQCWPSE